MYNYGKMEELDNGWQIIVGKIKVLVVAGHNFSQGREGKIKWADLGTGELVRKICDDFKFWGIISTREQMDPNWYVNSPFREKIREIVKKKNIGLIIDIHGKNLGAEKLVELKGNKKFKEKYKIKVNDFVENDQETLAEEMNNLVPVLQMEIREDGRVKTIDEVKYNESGIIVTKLMKHLT